MQKFISCLLIVGALGLVSCSKSDDDGGGGVKTVTAKPLNADGTCSEQFYTDALTLNGKIEKIQQSKTQAEIIQNVKAVDAECKVYEKKYGFAITCTHQKSGDQILGDNFRQTCKKVADYIKANNL